MYYTTPTFVHLKGVASFVPPRNQYYPLDVGYSLGGVAINDTSQGLASHVWKSFLRGNDICVQREGLAEYEVVATLEGVIQLDLAFDQTMRPFVCFSTSEKSGYIHFNPLNSVYEIIDLPSDVRYPCCSLDYTDNSSISDIYMAYTRGGVLYYRLQRERYLIEHSIASVPVKSLVWRIGATVDGRFAYQWR